MTNRQKKTLILKIQRQAEKARACYQKKDDLLNELLPHLPIGEVIETKSGHFHLIDNFAEKNVGYRASSFHRFELKEVKSTKASSRAAKRPGVPSAVEELSGNVGNLAASPSTTPAETEAESVAVAVAA